MYALAKEFPLQLHQLELDLVEMLAALLELVSVLGLVLDSAEALVGQSFLQLAEEYK